MRRLVVTLICRECTPPPGQAAQYNSQWTETTCSLCRNYFCRSCLRRLPAAMDASGRRTCPSCRTSHEYAGAPGRELCVDEPLPADPQATGPRDRRPSAGRSGGA